MIGASMEFIAELSRPWTPATLALGVALLVIGQFYYLTPDRDILISLTMALVAYAAATWYYGSHFKCKS